MDFSRHPAQLAPPAEKGHQGIIGYCSLNTIGQSHMSPQGGRASWHTTQAAAFSILIRRVAAQYSREEATESTDKTVRAAGAQACAPLSCLDVGPIAACAWLVGDHWVRHYSLLLDLILDCEALENASTAQ